MARSVIRLRGLKRYVSKGTLYCYHVQTNTRLCPEYVFGSADFFREYQECERRATESVTVKHAKTLGLAIESYRKSPEFTQLRDRTRDDYTRVLDWLEPINKMPLSQVDRAFAYGLRDKAFEAHKRRFSSYVTTVFSLVIEHAVTKGMLKVNPVAGVKKIKKQSDAPEANVAWTADELAIYIDAAPPHILGPVAMARYLGIREGDILALPRTAVADGFLTVVTSKTGAKVRLPIPAALQTILDALPSHKADTLFANSRGKPWTEDGFRVVFFKLRNKLAESGQIRRALTFHGLRTTFAQRADNAGLDIRKIADAMAHRSTATTAGYIRSANAARNQTEVIESLWGLDTETVE